MGLSARALTVLHMTNYNRPSPIGIARTAGFLATLTSVILLTSVIPASAVQPVSPTILFRQDASRATASWPGTGSYIDTDREGSSTVRYAGDDVSVMIASQGIRIGYAWGGGMSYTYQDTSRDSALKRLLTIIGRPKATWLFTRTENRPARLAGYADAPIEMLRSLASGAQTASRSGRVWTIKGSCDGSACSGIVNFAKDGSLSRISRTTDSGTRVITVSTARLTLPLLNSSNSYQRSDLTFRT